MFCVVVDIQGEASTHFRLLFYTTFLQRHFLSECSFCAGCLSCAVKFVKISAYLEGPKSTSGYAENR